MNNERLWKNVKNVTILDPIETFVKVDGKAFNKPFSVSLEKIGESLQIKLNEDLSELNVTSLTPQSLDLNPGLPPGSLEISNKTHIAVDENYLYVWIPQLNKWKRTILSNW